MAIVDIEYEKWQKDFEDEFPDLFKGGSLTGPVTALRRDLMRTAYMAGKKASRQPVGAGDKWLFVESPGEFTERLRAALQEFDLLGAVRNVLIENPPTLVSRQAVQSIDLAENLLSVLIEEGVLSRNGRVFQKLRAMIDGRDAGTGVGNIQPPRDLRTKLGDA